MKFKYVSIISILLLCQSCIRTPSFSSSVQASSGEEVVVLTKEEKFDYYMGHGGGVVFTWTLPDFSRRYATLGNYTFEHWMTFSFNNIAYCQTIAPLTLDEINPILEELYHRYKRSGVFLVEIPCPITEQFYYEDYLLYYPSSRFFVQDENEWNKLFGGSKGFEQALEKGLVSRS